MLRAGLEGDGPTLTVRLAEKTCDGVSQPPADPHVSDAGYVELPGGGPDLRVDVTGDEDTHDYTKHPDRTERLKRQT